MMTPNVTADTITESHLRIIGSSGYRIYHAWQDIIHICDDSMCDAALRSESTPPRGMNCKRGSIAVANAVRVCNVAIDAENERRAAAYARGVVRNTARRSLAKDVLSPSLAEAHILAERADGDSDITCPYVVTDEMSAQPYAIASAVFSALVVREQERYLAAVQLLIDNPVHIRSYRVHGRIRRDTAYENLSKFAEIVMP